MATLGGTNRSLRVAAMLCATVYGLAVACGGSAVVDGPGGQGGAISVAGATSVSGRASQAGAMSVAGAPSGAGAGAAASQLGPEQRACLSDNNCVLLTTNCCGACEPVAAAQLIASNYAYASTYANPNCANPAVCLPCNPVPESEQTGKYFKAVCQLALCTVVDVRESPLSECNKTSDCVLRDGADCCAQCDGSGWVPLNKTADLCGAPAACAPCAFARPTSWDTVCLGGRCRLEGPL